MTNKSTITNPSRRAICARAELIAQERNLSDGEIATVHTPTGSNPGHAASVICTSILQSYRRAH